MIIIAKLKERGEAPLSLSAQPLFEFVNQLRHHLVVVAYYTIRRNLKDRRFSVFVDGDDAVGCSHTRQVLDGTGNAACDIYLRFHRFSRLAHLVLLGYPARVDGRA